MPERDIKKKVITKQEEYDIRDTHCIETYYHCPKCDECFGNVKLSKVKHFNYCYICGQRLDWGD